MTEHDEALRKIDSKLTALLTVSVEGLLRQHPELGEPRPRSIEQILDGAGLTGVEIASVLGKTPQAVSLRLQTAKAKQGGGKPQRSATRGSGS